MDKVFDDALYRDRIFYKTAEQPKTYTVEKGDNLFRIAVNHNISLNELKTLNNLTTDVIHPGDVLVVSEDEKQKPMSVVADASTTIKFLLNNIIVEQPEENEEAVKIEQPSQPERTKITKTQPKQPTVVLDDGAEPAGAEGEMLVTATAYTAYCEGCSGTTAIGIDLRSNPNQKVIAVDPNVIPLGSKVWVEGYGEAIAGDTGGAIKGNKIDVFIPSHDQAMQWGVKKVKVKILN
ncbi:LysM peptidoglycan-binding domain-containing protein [Lysinibacillus telephonicus]|uniref:LysM peptidoglycan-binding domain-containing protein n=2 Tax=Lysinibacillus telephonicus TaxID=1714840 RepID=A0A431UTY7_9BACI|nr:LysM peptidoglycan-binding domain-containing protein [Lysinibacillus telephonicus]